MVSYIIYAFDYPRRYHANFVCRYEKVLELLKEEEIRKYYKILKPKILEFKDFEAVHDKKYLQKLIEMVRKDEKLGESLYFDSLGVSGTVYACELALKESTVTYHLGGSFHHAFRGAFDYLNDIAIAIKWLKRKYKMRKIMIIDLDVHHANGTQEIFYIMILEFYRFHFMVGTLFREQEMLMK